MTDTGTEAAIGAERAFYDAVKKLPSNMRAEVEAMAWGNAWSVECYEADKTNEQRWKECLVTLEMIADAPADYGIQQ